MGREEIKVQVPLVGCLVWLFAAALVVGAGLHFGGLLFDWLATL